MVANELDFFIIKYNKPNQNSMKYLMYLPLIFFLTISMNCLNAKTVKILIQGDTQKIMNPANGKQDNFVPLMAKLVTDPVTRDADFILQMGDIVESGKDNSTRPQQYAVARKGWEQLDGIIPYVLNIGNNDEAEEYFDAFDNLPEPLDENAGRRNFAYSFNAEGIDWLVISMRYWSHDDGNSTRDAERKWAIELIEKNNDKKVMFIKHEITSENDFVDELKAYPNLAFILSGHTRSEHTILTGDNGNKIAWIRTCHHDKLVDSYFRVLLIDTVKGIVRSSFYSPQYEKFWHDPTAPYHDCVRSAPWAYSGFDFGVAENVPSEVQENDAEFVSLDVPCCAIPNSTFDVTAKVLNTGSAVWDASLQENKYKLGNATPVKDNNDWGAGTNRKVVTEDVLPGAEHVFEINCTAPEAIGYYNFRRQMVKEGDEWFGEYSENRIVYVFLNQAKNPSFENDGTRSDAWELGEGASWTESEKRNGISSLKLSGTSTATIQTIELKKNTDYNLYLWVKRINEGGLTDDEKENDNARIDIFNAEKMGSRMRLKIGRGADKGRWIPISGRFNSGNSNSLQLRIHGDELKSTVYFDDIVVQPAIPPWDANVVSSTVFNAYKDNEFSFEVDVTELDESSLIYVFGSKPEWLDFDRESSILKGTPGAKDIGVHAVTLRVQDDKNEKPFAFSVNVLNEPIGFYWNDFHNSDDATLDVDQDGLVNFLEFALGGDPYKNDATDRLPKLIQNGSKLKFNFRRNQSTLNYVIKKSADMIEWFDYVLIDNRHGAVGDSCTINIPASAEKSFFKLEVSE